MKPEYGPYEAKIIRVTDGDTLAFEVDNGFKHRHVDAARLYGINTPELYKGDDREAGKNSGIAVLDWLGIGDNEAVTWYQHLEDYTRRTRRGWHILAGQPRVVIRSHNGKYIGNGKYGRWLIEVFKHDDDPVPPGGFSVSLNEWLVANGHAEKKDY